MTSRYLLTKFLRSSPYSVLTKRSSRRALTMTSPLSKEPRRFVALREGSQGGGDGDEKVQKLMGIVFDVDGTLCIPQTWMFSAFRSALSLPPAHDILDHIHSLSPADQESAFAKIRAIESEAMSQQQPQPGLVELMTYLESRNIPKAICTRNFDAPVEHLLGKFLEGKKFQPIITRDFRPPKPDPAGILHIARTWGLVKGEREAEGDGRGLIMVGDSIDDMTAGYRAGAATVLLVNEVNAHLATHEHTDLVISRLDDLIGILENGFVGRIGRGDEESDTKSRAESVLKNGKGEDGTGA